MKSILTLIFLSVLLQFSNSKILKKLVNLHSLSQPPQLLFLTKFDIGQGQGQIIIQYNKAIHGDYDKFQLKFGILKDQHYHQFRQLQTCQQRQKLFTYTQTISTTNTPFIQGKRQFNIKNQTQQHIWYIYLYDCKTDNTNKLYKGSLSFDIKMKNNGSYFGQDQNLLFGYFVILAIWVIMIVRLFIPVVNSMNQRSVSWQETFIYSGFILLGVSYFYRLISLILVYYNGQQKWYLLWFYKFVKYLVQGVMVTVIGSIGWGWSLTHIKQQPYYIITGTIISLINFMAMILQTSVNQIQQAHHQYQSLLGLALLLIRIIIFGLFLIGIFLCLAESVGKRRHFIKKFGYQGGAYFIAWPLAVVFVQLFLPNYMHNQVVTLVQQGTHIIAAAYMCHLFAFPDTDFKKVRIKDQDEGFPVYKNKRYNY